MGLIVTHDLRGPATMFVAERPSAVGSASQGSYGPTIGCEG